MPRNHRIGQSHRTTWNPGPSGPPKNNVTTTADIVIVFMNSARKNSAKRIDEYSVWNPPPSSDSPSERSKGGRFSSAVEAMKKMMNGMKPSLITFQCQNAIDWESTIARVERLCDSRITVTTVNPIAASYETICADARIDPRSGYFEPDDQPASIVP